MMHDISTINYNRLFFIVANYFLWIPKMQLFLRHKQSKGNKLVTSTGQPIAIIHSNMLHFWVPGLLLVHQRENCSWNEVILTLSCFALPDIYPISGSKSE